MKSSNFGEQPSDVMDSVFTELDTIVILLTPHFEWFIFNSAPFKSLNYDHQTEWWKLINLKTPAQINFYQDWIQKIFLNPHEFETLKDKGPKKIYISGDAYKMSVKIIATVIR